MTPIKAGQKGWEQFEVYLRGMSREDYIEACEELACTCQSAADAVQEELEEDE